MTDGREIAAELVVVGIGVSPATDIAGSAGLALDNGIAVDALGRTSDSAIWAAGDCASFPLHWSRIRLESGGNAIDHAECVAGNILGAGTIYMPKPWFWSDQYDVKLQIVGVNTGYDRVITRSGKGDAVSFWYYVGGRLLAVDAANDPSAYMTGKRIIHAGKSVSPDCAADPSTNLKDFVSLAQ